MGLKERINDVLLKSIASLHLDYLRYGNSEVVKLISLNLSAPHGLDAA